MVPDLSSFVAADDQVPLRVQLHVIDIDDVVEFFKQLETIGRLAFLNQSLVKQIEL